MKKFINWQRRFLTAAMLLPLLLAKACGETVKTKTTGTDSTAPDTTIDAGPSGTISNSDVTFTFSCDEEACTFECRLDVATFASCPSPQSYGNLTDGTHSFAVRALDQAGNMDETPASQGFTIDTTVPDTTPPDTVINSGPRAIISNSGVSFTFSCNEGTCTYACQLDTGVWAACTSPQSYTGLADGIHTFRVRALDKAGNTDWRPADATFIVDTTVPDTTAPDTLINSWPGAYTNAITNQITFSCDEARCHYECQLNGGSWSGCVSPWTYFNQADGSYTLEVRATDWSGNTDPTAASRSWTVDTLPPDTTIDGGPSGTTSTSNATFTFGSNEPGATFWCQLAAGWSRCSSPRVYSGLALGSYTFAVSAVDLAGNMTTAVTSQTWTINNAAGGVPGAQWQLIPGGTFSMGGETYSDELPIHSITLSPFEMMSYEVTNGTYGDCVTAGSCIPPGSGSSGYGYGSITGDDPYRPVNYVNWTQAKTYCTWAGGRLPTEAEWEYAARGGLSGKSYPWGDSIGCSDANYTSSCVGTTTRVGSYAANGYGLYDMAGNVYDWVRDWYGSTYYSSSPATDPQGPSGGTLRVLRGGGFTPDPNGARVATRSYNSPTLQLHNIGFRCVR